MIRTQIQLTKEQVKAIGGLPPPKGSPWPRW